MELRNARIIAYDIEDDGVRQRVARYLEGQGLRIQKSVFIVNLPKNRLAEVRSKLAGLCEDGDVIDIIPVCASCRTASVRIGPELAPAIVALGTALSEGET